MDFTTGEIISKAKKLKKKFESPHKESKKSKVACYRGYIQIFKDKFISIDENYAALWNLGEGSL